MIPNGPGFPLHRMQPGDQKPELTIMVVFLPQNKMSGLMLENSDNNAMMEQEQPPHIAKWRNGFPFSCHTRQAVRNRSHPIAAKKSHAMELI